MVVNQATAARAVLLVGMVMQVISTVTQGVTEKKVQTVRLVKKVKAEEKLVFLLK